ncbi:histidine phosphatase family protein [Streptosporangium sp. NPDC006930]|uniref:histidine phosphatase family protein n=1 Tax=Streptosporangium sp. NPDC006930 TaxID=3154783 RepID=UPI00343DEB9A
MITTELLFTRHGQARCNVDGLVGGPRTCTGLTEPGRRQATLTARRIATEHAEVPFTTIYAGTRLRLQQTGEIYAAVLGLPLTIEPGLDGPIHGDADGRPWHEVKTAFGGGPHAHPSRPWAIGSDTWNGYLRRAGVSLTSLIERHDGERVLFAAHGETVLAAHTLLLGLPPGTEAGFTVDHGSLNRWQLHLNRLGQRRWMLDRHNDTAHLAAL